MGQLIDEFACYHECFLVGQGDSLVSLDGVNRGRESRKTHHGGEHYIDGHGLDNVVQRLSTGIDLHVRQVAHEPFQFVVACLVGYHHGGRLEAVCLFGQQLDFVVGGEGIDFIEVAVLLNDLQGLCTYRPRRA